MNASKTPSDLFQSGTPTNAWCQFHADGFSEPVSGVVTTGGRVMPGMPLGGLGTGFISLGTDGTLDYCSTIFNAFIEREIKALANYNPVLGENADLGLRRHHVPTVRRPFLGLSVGGQTWVLTTRDVSWTLQALKHAGEIHYWGHYPVADLVYKTDAPVAVALRAWSPFLPGYPADSNVPGAVFEVRLQNAGDAAQRGTLAFSFHGPREFETGGPVEYFRDRVNGPFTGSVVAATFTPEPISYTLGVIDEDDVRVGGEVAGAAWAHIHDVLPITPPTHSGAAVAVDFELAPGEARTIRFACTWYCPTWQAEERAPFPGVTAARENALAWYRDDDEDASPPRIPDRTESRGDRRYWSHSRLMHMYAARFDGALSVANHLAATHAVTLPRILAWQETVYAEDGLPVWLRDSLVNILALLTQESFWVRNADPNHWWGDDGLFVVNESLLSCPQQGCLANDQSGEWPVHLFFPGLSRIKLRAYKYHQKDNGQTPSTLGNGTELDSHWYDQQLTIDGQVYIHMVDRLWQATGDDGILEEFYESVRAGVRFMQTVDVDGDGLPDVLANNQYYDNWPTMAGAAIHVSGYWIATLRIAERMAKRMADTAFAGECRASAKHGSASIEERLWNEAAGSYLLYHQPETGIRSESILSDQLNGQWFAELHNLPRVFSEARVRQVLDTLRSHNMRVASFGIRTAVRPDDSTDREGFYSSRQCPSYSTLVPAMLMIATGDRDGGLSLVHSVWHKLVIEKSYTWDMPCQVTTEGDTAFGMEYYHNTMLWTLPMAALGQDIRTFCSPQGLAGKITAAAGRITAHPSRSPTT